MRVVQLFRLVMFLCSVLVLVACGGGQVAAPTAASTSVATTAPDVTAPAEATAIPATTINRGKGDPNAPVTVIEYSDFQ